MKYNFDQIIDRKGTNASKWEPQVLNQLFGEEDLLPFWVADMDFKVAQPIVDAIVKAAEHGIYGYSVRPEEYYKAIIDWTEKRFGWKIDKEWIDYTPGIVPAVNYAIQAFCMPGDKVVIQKPVYYPFSNAINNNGCHVVSNDLVFDGEKYNMDFEDLESKLKDPKVTMMILCSPHNPVSRVWDLEDLKKVAQLCLENNVFLISDEIHNDLVYSGYKHTIFGLVGEEFLDNLMVCTAPSKTFNLAGMQSSNVIIPNPVHRQRFRRILEKNSIGGQNPLSIVSLIAAYTEGEEWLEQLLEYLEGNIKFIEEYLKENLPKAKMIKPQATYLAWIDFSGYESDSRKLEELMAKKAKVAMDGGTWFGDQGAGYMRLNFACPRELLKKGLDRIAAALS
ncbi:MAG TPA: cystathionine beta-lyase [Tissierellales bacterium]|nr:cystathionine beta-lyase [Tissierellales bacterium]